MLFLGRHRSGDDFRTVNEVTGILANNCELSHCLLESSSHLVLLINEALPSARGTRITSESKVRLKTHLSNIVAITFWKRRSNFAYKVQEISGWLSTRMVSNLPVLFFVPGKPVPLSKTSRKTCESNSKGVESKGTADILGST